MSDNRDEQLEAMLRSRRVEAAGADLAERIIRKADAIPQVKNPSLWQLVRDLCAEFHLPKPAYVLAGALTLGVVLGLNTPRDSAAPPDGTASAQGFLSNDEGFL